MWPVAIVVAVVKSRVLSDAAKITNMILTGAEEG